MDNIKFLANGQAVNVNQELEKGFLVQNIYSYNDENPDGESFTDGQIYFVDKVFESAPTEVYDKRIAQLQGQIQAKEKELTEINFKVNQAKIGGETLLKKAKQYEQLQRLEDYLDGKITHFLILESYGVPYIADIKTDEAKCGCKCKKLKLLTLFGDTNGSLEWNVNYYSDGSGSSYKAFPCCSYEEALERLQKYIDENSTSDSIWEVSRCIKAAENYGLRIDPAIVERDKQRQKNDIQKKIEELEKKLNAEKEELKQFD